MVTNAIANLANPPASIARQISNYQNGFPSMSALMTPLTTIAMRGIMLFDRNITEDPNNIIPKTSNLNQVGCASGETNSNVPYRGILNISESKEIENGYRFVWDFATDKANGTIRSVALTCPAAGYYGVDIGQNDLDGYSGCRFRNLKLGMSNTRFTDMSSNTGEYRLGNNGVGLASGSGQFTHPIGSFEKDTYLFLQPTSGGPTSYIFQKYKLNYSKLTLKHYYVEEQTQITVSTSGARLSRFPIADDNYIYSFFKTTTNSFDFVKIDAITLEVVEEKNVVVQDAEFKQNDLGLQGTECNGFYYVCNGSPSGYNITDYYNGTGVYKINILDSSDYKYLDLVAENIITRETSIFLQNYNGDVMLTRYHDAKDQDYYRIAYIISSDKIKKSCWFWRSSSNSSYKDYILPSPWLPKPYVMGTNLVNYSDRLVVNKIAFGFDTCYMATINNLSTPVVKNETQTMKVTYEITEI